MIARNSLLNLAGHLAPLAAAIFLVPGLVSRLDAERFGFLALAWVLIAYFSLFDLGLARALSRLVAARGPTRGDGHLAELSHAALALILALGAVAGAALMAAAVPLCTRVLQLPAALQAEAVDALRILALSLPLVTVTAALRGILEAGQRFVWVNAIRVPIAVLTFAAPLVATIWSTSLVALAISLATARLAGLLAHWLACRRLYPSLTGLRLPRWRHSREMLGYGAWLTVSNVVGPLLVYLDRFAIGALIAVSAVAYYAAPYEVVSRLWLIPAAIAGVLFPAMAAARVENLAGLYRRGIKAVLIVVLPIALGVVLFAPEWLKLWLGGEYAERGARVAQVLGLGVTMNCLAYLPFTILQARGRADLTAKAHLVELGLYLLLLGMFVPRWGIEGAAAASALRSTVDVILLFSLAHYTGAPSPAFSRLQVIAMGLAFALVGIALAPFSLSGKVLYFVVSTTLTLALSWWILMDPTERARARRPLSLIYDDRGPTKG
jgi:O-antigen/teichoic acid export membrane protein